MFPELEELVGEWTAIPPPGKVDPHAPRGGWRFRRELDGKILVRENWSEGTRPDGGGPYRHTDLMVLSGTSDGEVEAHYWDSEGHHIHYRVRPLSGTKGVEFLSAPQAQGSAYRLTYSLVGPGKVEGRFEIRPPAGDRFQPFLEWAGVSSEPGPHGR